MSTAADAVPTPDAVPAREPVDTAAAPRGGMRPGRLAGLIMPAVLAAASVFLLVGSFVMDDDGADFPGPAFFPTILGVAGLVVAVALVVQVLRGPLGEAPAEAGSDVVDHPAGDDAGPGRVDLVALAWALLGFLAFALLLPWLGWILAGALLFWTVCRAFRSPHPLWDVLVSLFVSSLAYLGFAVALGLTLPSGILGGGF